MDREVTVDKDPLVSGWNGATEHSIFGMAGATNSQLQGALTAAYAGLTRGADRKRVKQLLDNVEQTAKLQGPKALQNAMASCIVLGFQKRDCRGGDGEKDISRWWMLELWNLFPKSVEALAPLFPEYGYWKDLILYIQDLHQEQTQVLSLNNKARKYQGKLHPLAHHLYQIMISQLKDDLTTYQTYQQAIKDKTPQEIKELPKPTISLVSKWIPKEGRSFDKKFGASKYLARLLNPELYQTDKFKALKQYRQTYSQLNEIINTTERLMSLNRWDEIEYRLVPGKCLQKHRRAFLNLVGGSKCKTQDERSTDPKRRQSRQNLMQFMELAAQGKVQIKGKNLHIHEIVNKFGSRNHGRNNLSPEEKLLLELQWKTKRDELKTMIQEQQLDITQFVIMSDLSDSMIGTPIDVSLGFGIMLSEIIPGPWGNRVLSFSENPSWIVFQPDMSLEDKIQHALQASWGGSTNFLKAHDMILLVAIKNKLKPHEMPKGFLCVSDMQFNSACRGNNPETHFDVLTTYSNMSNLRSPFNQRANYYRDTNPEQETIHQLLVKTYDSVGRKVCGEPYTMGRSVYWNVQGATAGFPVESDTPHTQLVSGFAIEMINLVFQGKYVMDAKEPPTPWQLLVDILSQDRYHTIYQHIQDTKEGIFHDFKAPPKKETPDPDLVIVSTPDTLHAELQTLTAQLATLSSNNDPDSKAKTNSIQTRIQEIIKLLADPSIYN